MARVAENELAPDTALRGRVGSVSMLATLADRIRGIQGGRYWVARSSEGVLEVVRADATRGSIWFVPADRVMGILRQFLSGADAAHRRLVVVAPRRHLDALDVGSDVFDVLGHPFGQLRLELVLRNGFDAVDRILEREAASRALLRTEYEERTLIDIASALAAERNIDRLLSIMLERFRAITGADAGSIWIVERGDARDGSMDRLKFRVCQNDSTPMGGSDVSVPIDEDSIVGYAALTAVPVQVADCYDLPAHAPFSFSDAVDKKTGYQTRSMLTVPMVNRKGRTIGVIQLINRKREPSRILTDSATFDHEVIPFSRHEVELATTLAVHAAISLENAGLYEHIQSLFDRFVDASVRAIESRDPATSGHSHRVAALSLGLLEQVDRTSAGPFAASRFDRDAFKTLRYASLLHDFGKVTVPETVLLKAKKLYPWQLEHIVGRVHYVMRDLERRALERKLAAVERHGLAEARKRYPAWDAELGRQLGTLQRRLAWIHELNEPHVVEQEQVHAIEALGRETYVAFDGTEQPLLTPDEVAALSIRRGSLTRAEYEQIQQHVLETWKFLKAIPWPTELEAVPQVALMHHEKLDGSGYPFGAPAEKIPVEARILTIADIFDALSASDRPYKPAVPLERALDILRFEADAGKIDADLLDVFVHTRPWETALPRVGELDCFGPSCSAGEPHTH